ncbi:Flagellum-specific peptidoglycan hydrolase FlgJ [Nonlabens sp. Hel1_33_55]|uniref:glucosaminidase domain-containing protein n=1 Tax=Nonlabens sp. Hel1_33_55 TaxID=1336802 RepID=UPI000875E2F0|nr:glucosaminidase domain-containing protein [Nonlabens sp. Hel1_33_55]SCX90942.1 Flagellum-specific peptidoglycan hydrolase FlgJ [Nonlabens sp. Hel1_33_55]
MKITFKTFLILFLAAGLLVSCGSKNKVVTTKKRNRTSRTVKKIPEERVVDVKETDEKVTRTITPSGKDDVSTYIDNFAADAMKEMQLYKIPASITLAQGILESGSGKGRLAVEANNHFGVKCHTGWTGNKIYHDDDASQECFRKYRDASYSYRDHSLFLTERSRYSGLFKLDADDYKAWAKGLKDAGYATDRKYPDKLISLIERYRLDRYDAQVLGKKPMELPAEAGATDQIQYTIIKGDTLYGLAKKHNTTVDRIKLINGLRDNSISIGSTILIEPDTKN